MVQHRLRRLRDRELRRIDRAVAGAIHLPDLPRKRGVWMVAMVKNEADIITASIEHAFEQGICHALIADNGSVDGTKELLHELSSTYPLSVAADSMVAYEQDSKMTHLARVASRHGATWVIPMDADEFWTAPGTTVAQYLESSPADVEEAVVHNVFPLDDLPIVDRAGQFRIDRSPSHYPKVAVRAHRSLWISMGNHAAIRGVTRRGGGLRVTHLPWRSFEQFSAKVTQGKLAIEQTGHAEGICIHWRHLGAIDAEPLRARWSALLRGERDDDLAWTPIGPFEFGQPFLSPATQPAN